MPKARGKRYTIREEPYRLRNRTVTIERDGTTPPRARRQSNRGVITPGITLPPRSPRGPSQRNRPTAPIFGIRGPAPAEVEDEEDIPEEDKPANGDAVIPDSDNPAGSVIEASSQTPLGRSFSELPGELRNMVYKRLFSPHQHNHSLDSLLTNRQFRTEALDYIGVRNPQPGSTRTNEEIGLTTVWNRTWVTLRHSEWTYNIFHAILWRARMQSRPIARLNAIHRIAVRGPGRALNALHHMHVTHGTGIDPREYRVELTNAHLQHPRLRFDLLQMIEDTGNHTHQGQVRSITFTITNREAWYEFTLLPLAYIDQFTNVELPHHTITWPDSLEQRQFEYLENYRLHARFATTDGGAAAGYHDFDVYVERPQIRWRSNTADDPERQDYVDEYNPGIQQYLNGQDMNYRPFNFSDYDEPESEEDGEGEGDGQDGAPNANDHGHALYGSYDENDVDLDTEYSNEDRDDWEGWVPGRPAEADNDEVTEGGETAEGGEIDESGATEDGEIAEDGAIAG